MPRQFIPSVEKGVRAQMERGVVAGYPVVDIRVTLLDGKAHSVDSSDMAFQMAGALALKEAAAAAQIAMLEPVASISVLVSDEYVGAVMGDLSGRRGRVSGSEPAGNGRTLIRAEVPELELTRYAIELRSMSHGTGTFTREYIGHEPMPPRSPARSSRRPPSTDPAPPGTQTLPELRRLPEGPREPVTSRRFCLSVHVAPRRGTVATCLSRLGRRRSARVPRSSTSTACSPTSATGCTM